jgi:hypothetical protein
MINNTNKDDIQNYMNKIHPELQFKATGEIDSTINFLDLLITREKNKLSINTYHKPTTTDTMIHYKSNHPLQHKLAAYRFMLNRLHSLPLSQDQKNQEMNTITQIAKQNGYRITLIIRLNNQIRNKINRSKNNTLKQNTNNKKWITFDYNSPLIRKVTNIFKNTNLKITFCVSHTIRTYLKPIHKTMTTIQTVAFTI